MAMMMRLLGPLVATIVIELGVLLFMGERHRKVLYGSVAMNVLTNVPLNLYAIYMGDVWNTLIVGEILVVLTEALCYKRLVGEWRQAWIYSLLCNAISFLTGELFVLIFYLFTS
jgi:hypothetical protein